MDTTGGIAPDEAGEWGVNLVDTGSACGQVTADGGTVTLVGQVADDEKRESIDRRFRSIGTHRVLQKMDVPGGGDDDCSQDIRDMMIAAAAGEALLPYINAVDDRLVIRVVEGWIELEGEVEDYQRRQTLDRLVRGVKGVTGVTNSLNVRSDVSVQQLKSQVSEALDRVTRASAVA